MREIVLLDNSGKEYSAIVQRIESRRLLAHITGAAACDKEPKSPIYLLCGALKGDKTELVVQKAVELGAGKIGVFSSEFCSAYMNENKLARLNKVAHEAAKQCLRSVAPPVEYASDFERALHLVAAYDTKFFACEFLTENEAPMSEIEGSCAVMVGSEGGFCEEEFEAARAAGFCGITLGKRILRAETAAIAVLALVARAMGELG